MGITVELTEWTNQIGINCISRCSTILHVILSILSSYRPSNWFNLRVLVCMGHTSLHLHPFGQCGTLGGLDLTDPVLPFIAATHLNNTPCINGPHLIVIQPHEPVGVGPYLVGC